MIIYTMHSKENMRTEPCSLKYKSFLNIKLKAFSYKCIKIQQIHFCNKVQYHVLSSVFSDCPYNITTTPEVNETVTDLGGQYYPTLYAFFIKFINVISVIC